MVIGTSREDGSTIEGFDHLRQSVTDILTTPRGSRVLARDYGCDLTALIDHPGNQQTLTDAFAAIATALLDEPRFDLVEIGIEELSSGLVKFGPLRGHWQFNWPDPQTRFIEIQL